MNNHCVPDFKIQLDEEEEEEEYPMPICSSAPKKPSVQNDEIMKLSWQNGQVVLQSQNQGQPRKPPSLSPARNTAAAPADPSLAREAENYHNQHLFMQDDEMASWLHYSIDEDLPLDHRDFCADMIYAPPQNHRCTAELLPPIPQARRIQNFAHISKHSIARAETAALRPQARLKGAAAAAPQSTVVDSCETPAATATAAVVSRSSEEHAGRAAWSDGGGETAATCEMTVTSSPGGSSGSAEAVVEQKRKRREAEDSEFQSEQKDIDFESRETKKQVRAGSTSTKRSRAAEVHNLSERRRRDRINKKMRALQELIPQCDKSDKASMLDEAIEYLKSLQLQVQMMSMGCGMVPMMLPGIQQYMPPMGMGIGMGMGMEMGMNGPVMPFPNMLASSTSPAATAAAHLGPRFPMPPFHMPHVLAPDSSRMQAANQTNNMLTSLGTPDPDQSRIPNFTDPYQQYLGPHHMHLHLMQAMNEPNAIKQSTSNGQENPEKHQPEEP